MAKKIVEITVKFPFEKEMKTMDRLPKMHGQKIFEIMVKFSI